MAKDLRSTTRHFMALAAYVAFAAYLYQPYWRNFQRWEYLFLVNSPLAAVGCYVLSRRWVSSFVASFFAGAIYGFGPFTLGLAKFHPTAGFLAATIPWLFCPAAFGPKQKWRWLSIPLSLLPFLAIVVFFQVSLHYRLFAVPAQARLRLADLLGLIAPLTAAKQGLSIIGFYHIAIAPLIIGFSMLVKARRTGIMAILTVAAVLAFCKPFLNVSPIIWLTIAVLCCSILIGAGTQGLISAGFADRKWVLATAGICGALAIVMLLLATKCLQTFLGLGAGYARFFTDTGRMYALGAVTMLIIFLLVRAKLPAERRLPIRAVLLCLAMATDIFLGARFIVYMLL
jgi:hypothetical protein